MDYYFISLMDLKPYYSNQKNLIGTDLILIIFRLNVLVYINHDVFKV